MTARAATPLSASETAQRLMLLCRTAARLAQLAGSCVGEIRAADIRWVVDVHGSVVELTRDPGRGWRTRLRHRLAMRRHAKRGHDHGCKYVGVPLVTLGQLLHDWGGEDVAALLMDAVDEAIAQLHAGTWQNTSAVDVLNYLLGRRITVPR